MKHWQVFATVVTMAAVVTGCAASADEPAASSAQPLTSGSSWDDPCSDPLVDCWSEPALEIDQPWTDLGDMRGDRLYGGWGGGAAICSDVTGRVSGQVADDYSSAYASLQAAAESYCRGVDQSSSSCRVYSTRVDVDFGSGYDCYRPVGGGRICSGQVTCRRTNR